MELICIESGKLREESKMTQKIPDAVVENVFKICLMLGMVIIISTTFMGTIFIVFKVVHEIGILMGTC